MKADRPSNFVSLVAPLSQKIFALHIDNPERNATAFRQTFPAKIFCEKSHTLSIRQVYVSVFQCSLWLAMHCNIAYNLEPVPPVLNRLQSPFKALHPPSRFYFIRVYASHPYYEQILERRFVSVRRYLLFRLLTPRPIFIVPVSRCLVALSIWTQKKSTVSATYNALWFIYILKFLSIVIYFTHREICSRYLIRHSELPFLVPFFLSFLIFLYDITFILKTQHIVCRILYFSSVSNTRYCVYSSIS